VSCGGIYTTEWAWVTAVAEDTVKAAVVQVYCRVFFDQWHFLLLLWCWVEWGGLSEHELNFFLTIKTQ